MRYYWLKFLETLKKCLEIYELDPAKLFPATGIAWQVAFKKTKVELELLTDTDMLLMVEIRRGICHSINRYAKNNDKNKKDYEKITNHI